MQQMGRVQILRSEQSPRRSTATAPAAIAIASFSNFIFENRPLSTCNVLNRSSHDAQRSVWRYAIRLWMSSSVYLAEQLHVRIRRRIHLVTGRRLIGQDR